MSLEGNTHAILKTDVRVSDYMTAEVVPGSWLGDAIPGSGVLAGGLPGWNTMQFASSQNVGPVTWHVRAAILVTATGSDGAVRKYLRYCFVDSFAGVREYRPETARDWFIPDTDSMAAAMARWSEVAKRGVEWLGSSAVAGQQFLGVTPAVALQTYPRTVKVIRDLSIWQDTYYIRRIPMDLFRAYFGYQEWQLRASGDWPDRKKNIEDRVKVEFRKEFIEAMHQASV